MMQTSFEWEDGIALAIKSDYVVKTAVSNENGRTILFL